MRCRPECTISKTRSGMACWEYQMKFLPVTVQADALSFQLFLKRGDIQRREAVGHGRRGPGRFARHGAGRYDARDVPHGVRDGDVLPAASRSARLRYRANRTAAQRRGRACASRPSCRYCPACAFYSRIRPSYTLRRAAATSGRAGSTTPRPAHNPVLPPGFSGYPRTFLMARDNDSGQLKAVNARKPHALVKTCHLDGILRDNLIVAVRHRLSGHPWRYRPAEHLQADSCPR